MSNLLNICGIIIASSQYPDATLQQFYRQYYHCEIKTEHTKTEVQSTDDLSMFFPYQDTWWPILQLTRSARIAFNDLFIKGSNPALYCQMKFSVFLIISCSKRQSAKVRFQLHFINQSSLNILLQKQHFRPQLVYGLWLHLSQQVGMKT